MLTKVGLSTAQIGYYESFMLISGITSFFWLGGLMNTLVSFAANQRGETIKRYFFNAFLILLTLNILVNGVIVFANPLFQKYNLIISQQQVVLLLLFNLLNHTSYLVEHYYLITKNTRWLNRFSGITFIVTILLCGVILLMHSSLDYLLFAIVLSASFRFMWLIAILIRNNCFELVPSFLYQYIWQASLLSLSILLGSLADYLDEILVNLYFSKQWFAIFKYGAKEFPLLLLFSNALNTVFIQEIGENKELGLQKIKQLSARLMYWIYPLMIGLLFTSYYWFPKIFSASFDQSNKVFNIYLMLAISRMLFPQSVLSGLGKNQYLVYASIFELIVHVGLSLVFLQWLGIYGIAAAAVIAYLSDKIFLMLICRYRFQVKVSSYVPIKTYLFFNMLLIVSFVVWNYLR